MNKMIVRLMFSFISLNAMENTLDESSTNKKETKKSNSLVKSLIHNSGSFKPKKYLSNKQLTKLDQKYKSNSKITINDLTQVNDEELSALKNELNTKKRLSEMNYYVTPEAIAQQMMAISKNSDEDDYENCVLALKKSLNNKDEDNSQAEYCSKILSIINFLTKKNNSPEPRKGSRKKKSVILISSK